MIIGGCTFQTGLPTNTRSYRPRSGMGSAIAGRASLFCSSTLRATVGS